MDNLRIGLPKKGRLAEQAAELLTQAGLRFRRQDRSLFARVRELPVDITFLRTDDIPVLCAEGAIDLGITGTDLIEETGVELTTRLALGYGHCRLSVCVPEDAKYQAPTELDGCRIATSFPRVTKRFFQQCGADVHVVPLSGSVEIMIALGVAEGIVDIVQTGSTMAANRLRVLTDIGHYETVLVQNHAARQAEVADRVIRRLEGVVIARSWSLLEYNVPRAQAGRCRADHARLQIANNQCPRRPGLVCGTSAMVQRKDLMNVMDQLEAIGATAILETRINNCRL